MPKWIWLSMNRYRMFSYFDLHTTSKHVSKTCQNMERVVCKRMNYWLIVMSSQSILTVLVSLFWSEQNRTNFDRLCTDHTWEFFWRTLRILRAVVESRPEVGSSRKRMEGSTSISYPILVRLRSPPDTPRIKGPPILVFLHLRRKLERERPKPNFTKFVSMMSRIYSYLDFFSFLFDRPGGTGKTDRQGCIPQLCIFCEIGINFCGDN